MPICFGLTIERCTATAYWLCKQSSKKTIKKLPMIDVFWSKLCLLYLQYPVSIGNIQHNILRHCLLYYLGVQPKFCYGSLTICNKEQSKEWRTKNKMAIIFDSDLTMTPFFNFWLCNFNLKSLSRNHPCYGASCQTMVDAPWGIDNKSTL